MSEKVSTKRKFFLKKKVEERQENRSKTLKRSFKGVVNVVKLGKNMKQNSDEVINRQKSSLVNQKINQISDLNQEFTKESDQEDQYMETTGPQLKIDKVYVSFIQKTGLVATDSVEVVNNGSTAIYYEWIKLKNQFNFSNSLYDSEDRFFCHHKKNVIKPGQRISFEFSFRSNVSGVFYEEWKLKTEPQTNEPLPNIKFTGHAIENDENVQWRNEVNQDFDNQYIHNNVSEIVNDIFKNVKTPTPPLPDLDDPEVCKFQFEKNNKKHKLWYSQPVVQLFKFLNNELNTELNINEDNFYWDLNIDHVKQKINKIPKEEKRLVFQRKFDIFFELSKFRPYDRSPQYGLMKKFLENLIIQMPTIANNTRKENDLWDYNFQEPQEMTEEELKKRDDENAKIKADWLKKSKKKKFTEEDEKLAIDQFQQKYTQKCSDLICDQLNNFEEREDYLQFQIQIRNFQKPSQKYFQKIVRKRMLQDQDIEGRKMLVRVHLKISDPIKKKDYEKFIMYQQEEEKRKEEEKLEQQRLEEQKKQKGRSRPPPKNKKKEDLQVEEEKKEEPQPVDIEEFLDVQNLRDIIDTLKFLLDRQAKIIVLLISYDKPQGREIKLSSIQFFIEYLRKIFDSIVINFSQSIFIDEFNEKLESEYYPENSLLVIENAFFFKEETGFYIDENGVMEKIPYEEKLQYIEQVTNFGTIYIIEDKVSLFQNYTSMNHIQCECNVLGLNSGIDILNVAHSVLVEKSPLLLIFGGELSPLKLLTMCCLVNQGDSILLLGKIGILYAMFIKNLDEFLGFKLIEDQKASFKKFKEYMDDKNIEICYPGHFIIVQNSEEYPDNNFSPEWLQYAQENQQSYYFIPPLIRKEISQEQVEEDQLENSQKLEKNQSQQNNNEQENIQDNPKYIEEIYENPSIENCFLLDFGDEIHQKIIEKVNISMKIFWVDQCGILENENFNQTNKVLAKVIYHRQEEKRKLIEEHQREIQFHDYNKDMFVTCFGNKIEQMVSLFDLIEKKDINRKKTNEESQEQDENYEKEEELEQETQKDYEDDENDSQGSERQRLLSANKKKNVSLISDFFIKNSEFAMQIITGKQIKGLDIISEFDKIYESDPEGEFEFLYDI